MRITGKDACITWAGLMDNQNNEKAKRGIDSIAHLFLSQLGKDNSKEIKRTPPGATENGDGSPSLSDIKPEISESKESCEIDKGFLAGMGSDEKVSGCHDLKDSLAGEIVLAYHLRDSYKKVREYAAYLSQRDERVALLSIDQYELTMITTLQPEGIGKTHVLAETECKASELIPLINEAAEDYDMIILNVDPSFSGRVNEIISYGDCITIISDSSSDGIIRAYQVLKSVSDNILDDQEIQLFICDADSSEQADRAFYKFNDTAQKFINKVIIPAGFTLASEHGDRPIDDLGITEQEMLDLNLAEAGIADLPEPESEPKPTLNCEHYINSHDRSEITEIFVRTEETFVPDSFETISSEGVEYANDLDPGMVDKSSQVTTSPPKPRASDNVFYKPASSKYAQEQKIAECNKSQIDSSRRFDNKQYRLNVISRPGEKSCNGPAKAIPVRVSVELVNEQSICGFVCMNLGLLTGINGWVSTEIRSFSEQFTNARILIDPNGHIKILISAVFSDDIADEIESVSDWLSDNIGVLTTRYRHLHINSGVRPELLIIAGENYNAIYDQAIIVADEMDEQCRVMQLIRFELGNEIFVSLR